MGDVPPELPPTGEDERAEDVDTNPAVEPVSAKSWLNLLRDSEDAFDEWNDACDNIEKLYANLQQLRSMARDRQFRLFWANMEILKPTIYAKPPVPVVVPKFKDRRPLYQVSSEFLERCSVVAFDVTRINDLMLLVRDDLALTNRGVAWCRFVPADPETGTPEYVCIDHKPRRDFLHSLSRNWREVTWVAGASYLTRAQARARFRQYSGDEYRKADFKVDKQAKEIGGGDKRERAKFWELWHKSMRTVVWVAEGCDYVLDQADPDELARLTNFFPCPPPALGVCQPGSLVPVPDVLQYKDQLDEVNTLTGRIHALSDALEVKGFYPAGTAELSDAIQAAVQLKSNKRILVPISNWAAFGGTKEVIIWLPIDMIVNTITALIALRKQVIEDIYQIMGLSDIMRGATDPNETLGAQQMKSQYGSARIRDKQAELVRVSRDLVEVTAEIMCADYSDETLVDMAQLDIPTEAQQQQKLMAMQQQMQQQAQQAQAMIQQAQQMHVMQQQQAQVAQGGPPGMPAQAGGPPGSSPGAALGGPPPGLPMQPGPPQPQPPQLQQMMQQFEQQLMQMQQQLTDEAQKPTLERVLQFLRDYRTRVFVLDIETDSTIQADENVEKQRRGEFIGMLAQLLPQLAQLIAAEPGSAKFCGELLKFSVAPFRVGRSLDGSIDELVEQIELKSAQNQGNPKQSAEQQKLAATAQIESEKIKAKQQQDERDNAVKMAEVQSKERIEREKLGGELKLAMFEAETERQRQQFEIRQTQIEGVFDQQEHEQKMREGDQKMALNAQNQQLRSQQQADRRADMASRRQAADRSQVFKEQQAAMRPLGGGR